MSAGVRILGRVAANELQPAAWTAIPLHFQLASAESIQARRWRSLAQPFPITGHNLQEILSYTISPRIER